MLNMRSNIDEADLSTRARIRDAALLRFGADGFERATVRAIAKQAGVSPALVIHHFGSKERLQAACTQAVVDEFLSGKEALLGSAAAETLRGWLADVERFRPYLDYLARLLVEDAPAADEVFDALLAATGAMLAEQTTAGLLRPSSDPQATALIITLHGVAPLLLQRQIARTMGEGAAHGPAPLSSAALLRLTLPSMEMYTHGLYADDRLLEMTRAALAPTAGKEPEAP